MRTFGLGGDSEVSFEEGALVPQILLGPRRLVPLSLAARLHGQAVSDELDRQLRQPNAGRLDGRFAWRTGLPERFAAGLSGGEAKLYAAIGDAPMALDRLLASNAQTAALNRLVARGLVHLSGFTPSDAAHVLGSQRTWDADAARLGALLLARRKDGRGLGVANSAEALARRVLDRLRRRSAEVVLESAFCEDGLEGAALVRHPLVARSLDARPGIAALAISLDRPVIGLGASAGLHYAGLEDLVGSECMIPRDSDVANAVGAVVGHVRIAMHAVVTQPREGLFRVSMETGLQDFASEEAAMAHAEGGLADIAATRAGEAGADGVEVEMARDFKTATVEGQRSFVEAVVTATATGRPRLAHSS